MDICNNNNTIIITKLIGQTYSASNTLAFFLPFLFFDFSFLDRSNSNACITI